MKKSKTASGLLFISPLLLFIVFPLMAQLDEPIDWNYEIKLLGSELASRHSDLFFQTDSGSFFEALNRVSSGADQETLFSNSVKLQQALASIGDANTRINFHFNVDPSTILPLDLYWFEDGLFVLKTRAAYETMVGKKLNAVNGFPLAVIADSLATLLPAGQPDLLKAELPRMITWSQLLAHFGFSRDQTYEFEFENHEGVKGSLVIRLPTEDGEQIGVYPDHLPLGWEDRKAYFRDQYFPTERLYYIQYNKCWSREVEEEFGSGASALFMPSFKEFEKKVFQTLRTNEIDKLVLDLRFNDGGQPQQGTLFIQKIGKARIKGTGQCYVIVGRETRDAALINAVDFINQTGALVVGECTGGKPNHFGDVKRFVLPESKLVVNYSIRYFTLLAGDPPTLKPGLDAPISFTQYMKGSDPALEAIIAHSPGN